MTQHYFTPKGDWGLSEYLDRDSDTGWIIVPTNTWTDSMFQAIDDSTNSDRIELAKHFNVGVHTVFAGKCQVCKLSISEPTIMEEE